MLDKIGVKFNIYYAGEFKSATEPFRLNKMSPENRLQLSEYLNEQFDLYTQQVAISRHIDYQVLKNNFNQFLSYSPQKLMTTSWSTPLLMKLMLSTICRTKWVLIMMIKLII